VSLVVSLTIDADDVRAIAQPVSEGKPGRPVPRERARIPMDARRVRSEPRVGLRHSPLMMLILAATIGLNVYLYVHIPRALPPAGRRAHGRLDPGLPGHLLQRCPKLADFVEIVRSDPAVENVVGFTGGASAIRFMFITLKTVRERKASVDQVIARLRPKLARARREISFSCRCRTSAWAGARQRQYQFTLQAD